MQCNLPEMKLIVDTDFVQNHSNKDPQLPKKKKKKITANFFIEKFPYKNKNHS